MNHRTTDSACSSKGGVISCQSIWSLGQLTRSTSQRSFRIRFRTKTETSFRLRSTKAAPRLLERRPTTKRFWWLWMLEPTMFEKQPAPTTASVATESFWLSLTQRLLQWQRAALTNYPSASRTITATSTLPPEHGAALKRALLQSALRTVDLTG